MQLDETLPIPLYLQLRNILEKQIQSGKWEVDAQIPTEQALCKEYHVSRITVRQALGVLEQDGLLYRRRGKGTFIKAPALEQRLFSIYSFSEQIEKSGRKSSCRVLQLSRERTPEFIAKQLHLSPGDRICKLYRLRLVDNEPFALETSYLPHSLSAEITADEIESKGLYATLHKHYRIVPDVVKETFGAVLIEPRFQSLLKVGKNAPGIHLERTTTCLGTVFEYCDCLIRGDRYKYSIVLRKY